MRTITLLALAAFALGSVSALADEEIVAKRNAMKFIEAADLNDDNAVDYYEHEVWLRVGSGEPRREGGGWFPDDGGKPGGGLAEADPQIRTDAYNSMVAAFARADADGNGKLDAAETANWPSPKCNPWVGCGPATP